MLILDPLPLPITHVDRNTRRIIRERGKELGEGYFIVTEGKLKLNLQKENDKLYIIKKLLEEIKVSNIKALDNIEVKFLDKNTYLLEVSITENKVPTVYFDLGIINDLGLYLENNEIRAPDPILVNGLKIAYKLGLELVAEYISSKNWRKAFHRLIEVYKEMSEEEKQYLNVLLSHEALDKFSNFKLFLNGILLEENRREYWISWIISQTRKDYAYDVELVREILRKHKGNIYSSKCVKELYNVIRNTYDERIEEENIKRLAEEARKRGQLVVFSRLGRASVVMGYLFAASKVIQSNNKIIELIQELEKLVKEKKYDELYNEVIRLKHLVERNTIPEAQLERCEKIFYKKLRELRNRVEDNIREKRKEGKISPSEALWRIKELNNFILEIERIFNELHEELNKTKRNYGVFVFFGQRLSPHGTCRIAYVNELLMPYAGPSYGLEDYIVDGGFNVHATPSLSALKYVDYWIEALPLFIMETKEGTYEIDYENMEAAIRKMAPYWALNIENAIKEGRPKPTFIVVTTQSYNMTNLVRYWLEEEMANFNIIRAHGLEEEVNKLVKEYRKRIIECCNKIVKEQHLEQALELELQKGISRERALLNLLAKDPEFARDVANLATVIEYGLEKEVESEAKRLMKEHPEWGREFIYKIARENVLKKYVIDTRTLELKPITQAEKKKYVLLLEIAKRYLRDHLDLAESTARKEVIVKHGLLKEVDKYRYEAVGPNKKYNLVYAPSRVDLGPHEIESVIDLGQPLGAFDREAGNSAVKLYEHINVSFEGAYVLPNPACAEGQKTLENASRDDNYAFANLIALSAEAMGANAYSIIAYINMRPTHLILWPGRGYGGFCIPKDGLFVSYVLGLKDRDILTKLGVPSYLHDKIIEIVDELLESKYEYEDLMEWQTTVQEKLGKYLKLFEEKKVYVDGLLQIADVLEKLRGRRVDWKQYLRYVARLLYESRYVPSRMVNNFMPYHTAALIYHALEKARKRNPKVCKDSEAKIGIQASYKPGVQDSRMTTEFELFLALTKCDDRLNRMRWKVLKEMAHMILDKHDTPAEIRVIDPLIDAEQWRFDDEIRLKAGAERLKELLLEYIKGFSEDDIRANLNRFGVNFEEWIIGYEKGKEVKVRDKPEIIVKLAKSLGVFEELGMSNEIIEKRIKEYGYNYKLWPEFKSTRLARLFINKIKGRMHWLSVYERGIERSFERGVRGLDVLSLGIPHPGLVKLVHNLPRLYFLMKENNPNSALAIVDGAAGARGLVFDKELVKEWLALGGTYVAIGISDEIIDEWYKEMINEKKKAEELLNCIMDGNFAKAQEVLDEIIKSIDERRFEELYWLAEGMELGLDAKEYSDITRRYKLMIELLDRIRKGLHIADLDFGTFIILGGRFVILDKARALHNYDEFKAYVESLRRSFEEKIRSAPLIIPHAPKRIGTLPKEKVDEVIKAFLLREVPKAEEEVEIVLGGALKGEMKEEWAAIQRRLIRIRQKRAKLIEKYLPKVKITKFDEMFNIAKRILGEPKAEISDEDYCNFLVHALKSIEILTEELAGRDEADRIAEFINEEIFKRGGISIHSHKVLIDHLAKLATYAKGNKEILEKIAKGAELVDISLAIELISTAQSWKERWTAVATFFDRTINCHIFDYAPYLYTRATFCKDENFNDVFTRKELFELIMKHHKWLYEYIRKVLVEKTELKLLDKKTVEKLLTVGTDGDDIAKKEGYAEASKFVFSYARLRDLATLYHDGFFIPEFLDNVDPSAIKANERVNVVIMYNLGNTTAMTFLRRGPYHHKDKGPDKNIIMTNFMKRGKIGDMEVALVEYGLMYLTEEEYRKAGGKNEILKIITDPELRKKYEKIGPEGRLVFIRFKKPIIAHVVFPHFTHPWFLNQTLEKMGVPLNQSRVIDRLTYKKTELPEMIRYYNERVPPKERIPFIDQVNIWRDEMRKLPPEERRKKVEEILLEFSKKHPKVIIKTSTESGGRGTIIARIRDEKGNVTNENIRGIDGSIEVYGFRDAVDFILREILPKDDAVVQEFIESRPREILTEEALKEVISRFEALGIHIKEDTPLYWSFRNYVTQVPGEEPQICGWIMLVHVKGIANYGQGGQLFVLERNMFKPQYRYLIDEMERVSKATMKMIEMYAPVFAKKEGIWVGKNALGIPYSVPMTNLSDMMLKPIYKNGEIVKWVVVPIEENIGMGLFYPYEKQLARKGREGESVDPILINLAKVGAKYRELIIKKMKEYNQNEPIILQ